MFVALVVVALMVVALVVVALVVVALVVAALAVESRPRRRTDDTLPRLALQADEYT